MGNNANRDREFDSWMRRFYNRKASRISDKGYEYARWFSSPRKRRQYKFSAKSLLFHLKDFEFRDCLEVGCGPGTWTRLLLKKYPEARIDCLDISKEMIDQFKKNITEKKRVNTIVSSFLDKDFKKREYDFLFSSRAIEYIPNKKRVIDKFNSLLKAGGRGIIISSPPHPFVLSLKKSFGKRLNVNHTKRISVKKMSALLKGSGFLDVRFYPILFSDFFLVPTSFLFRRLYRKRWGLLSKMFASGYIVSFRKPLGGA
jgi:ubiquinone/menaquinone biosynthesis C-methylase UbiE